MGTLSGRALGTLLIALCVVALLGGCSEATPAWGPGTPRNGAGQPVDAIYGTPLPGYPMINDN